MAGQSSRTEFRAILLLGSIAQTSCGFEFQENATVGDRTFALTACTTDELNAIVAPAMSASDFVMVRCNATLEASNPSHVVTKQLIFDPSASGAVFDCGGAMVDGSRTHADGSRRSERQLDMFSIRSRKNADGTWSRPENITIRNCHIKGSVRVEHHDATLEELRSWSRQPGFTAWMQSIAPRYVSIEGSIIEGLGRTPVYFAMGVTYSTLRNSELMGDPGSGPAMYLDAESAFNTIRGTYIHKSSGEREQLAIDGSASNLIIDNFFSGLDAGGIYLYRNCGEDGVSRHQTPSSNEIINNVFYYNEYTGSNPSVYLGSRNGNRPYCINDNDSDYGSGVSDWDYAQYNAVMQNQIYKRSLSDMITTTNATANSPNYLAANNTVTSHVDRLSGCYIPNGYHYRFRAHGETEHLFLGTLGVPTYARAGYACADGLRTSHRHFTPGSVTANVLNCQITGTNAGCDSTAICPSSSYVVGARAACNLEWGTVSDTVVGTVPVNTIDVVYHSDVLSEGRCWINATSLAWGSATIPIESIEFWNGVYFGCDEYDRNGGDCHVRGTMYCYTPGQ